MGWMGEWDRIWTNSGSQRRLNKLTSDLTQNRIVNRELPWDMMWYVRYINTLSFIHCVSSRIYIWYHVVNLIYSFWYQFFIIFIKFSVIKCFYFRFSFTILNKSKTFSLVAINSLCGSHWISILFHFIPRNIRRLKCLKNVLKNRRFDQFYRSSSGCLKCYQNGGSLLVVQLGERTWRIVIITRRINDVRLLGKCTLRPV